MRLLTEATTDAPLFHSFGGNKNFISMYLTYLLKGSITVTDSQGISPYSMFRT